MGLSITKIFGIFIRPRKKRRAPGTKSITLRYVITGTIPSLKNNKIAITDTREAIRMMENYLRQEGSGGRINISRTECEKMIDSVKSYIVSSSRYQKWFPGAKKNIQEQNKQWIEAIHSRGLVFPLQDCSLSIYHYWKDNRIRDNSNKQESIQDLFVSAGIITDDSWQALSPTTSDGNYYPGELLYHTTVINLTAYYKPQ